jgi:hypothetical protein
MGGRKLRLRAGCYIRLENRGYPVGGRAGVPRHWAVATGPWQPIPATPAAPRAGRYPGLEPWGPVGRQWGAPALRRGYRAVVPGFRPAGTPMAPSFAFPGFYWVFRKMPWLPLVALPGGCPASISRPHPTPSPRVSEQIKMFPAKTLDEVEPRNNLAGVYAAIAHFQRINLSQSRTKAGENR